MNILISDLIGKPFDKRGVLPGYNCWTLAKEVYSRYGVELPDYRVSAFDFNTIENIYNSDIKMWKKINVPEVPCLITMKVKTCHVNHVAVYIYENIFIHSYRGALQVKLGSLYGIRGDEWLRVIDGFYVPGWV